MVSLAQVTSCAPRATVLTSAPGTLPIGEFIVPSSHGYAILIDQEGASTSTLAYSTSGLPGTRLRSIGLTGQSCKPISEWYVSPPLYNDSLAGQGCWNGSVAWTNSLTTSCSVWVPGMPGTSCGSNYPYEQGRNTWWDYPNGVFNMLIYWTTSDCEHLYMTLNGNGNLSYNNYGC